jgi:hypothetical protein
LIGSFLSNFFEKDLQVPPCDLEQLRLGTAVDTKAWAIPSSNCPAGFILAQYLEMKKDQRGINPPRSRVAMGASNAGIDGFL